MTSAISSEAGPNPPESATRGRGRFWLTILLSLFFLWLAALYGLFRYRAGQDLREAMAEAARTDPGWQLDDIDAARAVVPDEENAALVALKVKALLPANWPTPRNAAVTAPSSDTGPPRTWDEQLHEMPPPVPFDETVYQSLRTSLEAVEPARREARRLVGLTRGRYPLTWSPDVISTTLQSQDARSAASLLRYEAALLTQEGNYDGAAACVRGVLGAARSVGDEPLIISVLIRIAGDAQALAALERLLAHGEPSPRELTAVQELLEQEAAEPLLRQAMRGERAALHRLVTALDQGDLSLAQVTGSPRGMGSRLLDATGPTLARRSHGRMLHLLNQMVEASQLPDEEQAAVFQEVEREIKQAKVNYDVVTALLMPAMIKAQETAQRSRADLRCALVAVALERYRCDHGEWPEPLEALVPRYLSAVPADPCDGKPLRYRRLPDGVLVYSVGPDKVDNGGALNRRNPLAKNTDRGFRLWDRAARRQPAAEVLTAPNEAGPLTDGPAPSNR